MTISFAKHSAMAVLLFFLTALGAASASAQTSANVYAVTNSNQLIRFNTSNPGIVVSVGPVTGLQAGENILGIDFRPATGELFALGSTSRIYTLNKTNASATFVALISTALSGTAFGFDFNPTVDRIRIVSNTGQNLRINPLNGVAIVDGAINGAAAGVDAAGYTNSFNGSTTTTLYDISATSDTLYTQNPPNNGTLVAVGPLGVNVTDVNGFDILSSDNTAYAALTTSVAPLTGLYTINLSTGAATLVGNIGNGLTSYSGFAVEIGATTNFNVYGVTTSNNLIRFNSSRPGTILSNTPITGLQAGENVIGIDFRPANGQLYALGSTSRLYRINQFTGAATQIGATGAFTLTGTNFGFDFNPVPDRIRVTSDADQNLRLNPNDGTLTATDGTIAYAAGDPNAGQNPNVVASAYTNSFAGTTTTTLYDIDSNLDILVTQNPPNNGTLNSIGSLGVNITGEAGFDISPSNNAALAALQSSGASSSALYSINLSTGAASPIGPIGGGAVVRDIAVGRSSAGGGSTATIDFDGDGRTDYAVFRTSTNTWFIARSSDNSFFALQFGLTSSDVLTPGDYDGDGRTDLAVWRTTTGTFYVQRSSDGVVTTFQWGTAGDEPLPRDYDGDGKTDFAVVRKQGGQLVWYIQNSSNGSTRIDIFGLSTDFAAPGDYDGDGRYDLAIHRGAAGEAANFYVLGSTAGTFVVRWGLGGDLVVPGDYDGDGKTDFAVVREGSPYTWYVLRSSDGTLFANEFGNKPHYPTQGDYDGDGKTDLSTWDPVTGTFYVLRTATPGVTSQYRFGQNGDYPVANYDTH
jgi:hypothetical protein